MILLLVGCGDKSPAIGNENSEAVNEATSNNGSGTDMSSSSVTAKSDEFILPDCYPKEIMPLAADAEIIDVRENPASNGLEIIYVSDNNIGTLRDFYEGALKNAQDLSTDETSDGCLISATMDSVGYTISIK